MTRRERAAMALALECLRETVPVKVTGRLRSSPGFREGQSIHAVEWARAALRVTWLGLEDLRFAMADVLSDGDLPRRLIRARLALYLRARLRAERGERGRGSWVPTGARCGRVDHRVDAQGRCGWRSACGCWRRTRRITPLWQQAPAHGHWRHGCWRCGLIIDVPRGEACDVCGASEPRRGGA